MDMKKRDDHVERISNAIDALLEVRTRLAVGMIPSNSILDYCAGLTARASALCFDLRFERDPASEHIRTRFAKSLVVIVLFASLGLAGCHDEESRTIEQNVCIVNGQRVPC